MNARGPTKRVEWIAFWFHLPGLRLFAGRGLPASARTENVVAVGLTLVAMAAAAFIAWPYGGRVGWLAVVGTWAAGHVAWGARLRAHVRHEVDPDSDRVS